MDNNYYFSDSSYWFNFNGDIFMKTVWAIFTDEDRLDSIWANEDSANAYIKQEEKKDPGVDLYPWELPLNNWRK